MNPPTLPAGFHLLDDPAALVDRDTLLVKFPPRMNSKRKLLAIYAQTLRLPGWFGQNWDALEECLCTLDWLKLPTNIVVLHPSIPFLAGGEHRQIYLSILEAATARWHEGPHKFDVVFPSSSTAELNHALHRS